MLLNLKGKKGARLCIGSAQDHLCCEAGLLTALILSDCSLLPLASQRCAAVQAKTSSGARIPCKDRLSWQTHDQNCTMCSMEAAERKVIG